jgi:hypothetical protein
VANLSFGAFKKIRGCAFFYQDTANKHRHARRYGLGVLHHVGYDDDCEPQLTVEVADEFYYVPRCSAVQR